MFQRARTRSDAPSRSRGGGRRRGRAPRRAARGPPPRTRSPRARAGSRSRSSAPSPRGTPCSGARPRRAAARRACGGGRRGAPRAARPARMPSSRAASGGEERGAEVPGGRARVALDGAHEPGRGVGVPLEVAPRDPGGREVGILGAAGSAARSGSRSGSPSRAGPPAPRARRRAARRGGSRRRRAGSRRALRLTGGARPHRGAAHAVGERLEDDRVRVERERAVRLPGRVVAPGVEPLSRRRRARAASASRRSGYSPAKRTPHATAALVENVSAPAAGFPSGPRAIQGSPPFTMADQANHGARSSASSETAVSRPVARWRRSCARRSARATGSVTASNPCSSASRSQGSGTSAACAPPWSRGSRASCGDGLPLDAARRRGAPR